LRVFERQASNKFNQALSIQPNQVAALIGAVKASTSEGQYKAAKHNLYRLKILAPGTIAALVLEAQFYSDLYLHEQAVTLFNKILQIEPDNYDAQIGLAKSYLQNNQFVHFQDQIDAFSSLSSPTVEQIQLQLIGLFKQRDFANLLSSLSSMKQTNPDLLANKQVDLLTRLSTWLVEPIKYSRELASISKTLEANATESKLDIQTLDLLLVIFEQTGNTERTINIEKQRKKRIEQRQLFKFS